MADSTARIGLPYIVQNQAQKEVTINQCLDIMDFYTGPVVKSFLSTLPDSPSDGDAYVLTGTVHPNYIAHRVNGAWEYYAPFDGCRILNNGDAIEYIYTNNAWVLYATQDAGARAEAAYNKLAAANPLTDLAGTDSILTLTKYDKTTNTITVDKVVHDGAGNEISTHFAPLVSPIFTGTVAIPTADTTDNSTKAASTAFVQSLVAQAVVGAVTYKGPWVSTGQTDFSGITLPVKTGYMYLVAGTGCTINAVEYQAGDYIIMDADVAAGGTIDPANVGKVDNTEGSDIVRLAATQTLTNKTLESPVLTGTPAAPTAAAGTNTTQVATTAFVETELTNHVATDDEAQAGTDDAKIMTPLKVKAAVTNLINSQDNFAGASFDGVNSAGTKLGLAANWTWEKSTELTAGQDDYRKYKPFNQQRFLVKTDSNGVAQIVDWEGTSSFDNHLHDEDYGADPFVKFDLSYVRRYYDANGVDYRLISDRYLPGYHIPKMFLRGSGNTLYPWIGISARPFSKTTSGALTTRSGHPIMYNKTENQFEALARAKGLFVAGQNEINYLQHLGTIKYCNYNWQSAVGSGVTSTYYSKDKSCTVSQTSANSLIVSNANAALASVGDYIGFSGSGSCQPDLPVTAIDTYDDNNKKITLDGLSLTSVVGDTGFYRMCSWGGETDSILGLDGEITTGTAWKRSVLTLGIENLFGNSWKLLAGACRIGTDIWINPDPDASYTWPTDAANAATLGWIKLNGAVSTTEGYIKTFINDSSWPLTNYCATVGGNSAGPVGDYSYVGTNMSSVMIVLCGDALDGGSGAGPFCCGLYGGVGAAGWRCGALGVYRPAL